MRLLCWILITTFLSAANAQTPIPAGVGPAESAELPQKHPCLSDRDYEIASEIVRAEEVRLIRDGVIEAIPEDPVKAHVNFIHPLAPQPGLNDPAFDYVLSYVDHDQNFGSLLDFGCGKRTADGFSVGWHRGTDFELWPYWWNKMYDEDVAFAAAADGVVLSRFDGNLDTSCAGGWCVD